MKRSLISNELFFIEFKESKTKKPKTKKSTEGDNETEAVADDDVEFIEESMDDE